jgi:hypothetical protein
MSELRELRILVDRTIDRVGAAQRHPSACLCAKCARRSGARVLMVTVRVRSPASARDADPFFVRRVERLSGPTPAGVGQCPFRVGEQLPVGTRTELQQMRNELLSRDGVFLLGATERQARRWAMRQARPYGGTVTHVARHRGGRPHFHITFPPGAPVPVRRSGHIFYGNPPSGSFLEFEDL